MLLPFCAVRCTKYNTNYPSTGEVFDIFLSKLIYACTMHTAMHEPKYDWHQKTTEINFHWFPVHTFHNFTYAARGHVAPQH